MVLVGSSNAVNLADGLDGLAAGTLIISAMTYAVLAYLAGNARFAEYLRIVSVPGAGELTVVLASLVGACLGFLWYNAHPAEVFMGDTGSLFLGGAIGIVALIVKQELLLVIVGGVFVAEALSVLLQVYSFRVHKRRIFKMAPLHHHFELLGWPESKVTIRFWIVAIVLSLFALASLKLEITAGVRHDRLTDYDEMQNIEICQSVMPDLVFASALWGPVVQVLRPPD